MSSLTICHADNAEVVQQLQDQEQISQRLGALGVRFERWPILNLAAEADQEAVLAAYAEPIERLNQAYDFQSLDVVSLRPDHPQREALRAKFLSEHRHDDFEIRFFVEGAGLFYLHLGDEVWMLWCEAGDLVSVPAETPHWFDMGVKPNFRCIRFFTTDQGWEARFTGDTLGERFPDFDQYHERYA